MRKLLGKPWMADTIVLGWSILMFPWKAADLAWRTVVRCREILGLIQWLKRFADT